MANSQAPTIDAIAGCCARIDAMCAGLDEAGWHRPTALPAWDVKDVVAHLGSLESMLLGRDEPAHEPAAIAHVRNPLGHLNECMVDRRRSWPGADVLAEFRETTGLRLEQLRGLDEAALADEVPSPRGGVVGQGDFIAIRLWDYVVHELDVGEALGLDLEAAVDHPSGRRVLDEMLMLLPRGVAKGGAAEGTCVALDIGPPLPRCTGARMQAGRGVPADHVAGEAALHLRASPAVFLRVTSGRRDAAAAIAAGEVMVEGDTELATRILTAMNVIP
ncbi:MAG: maleylpyruvate isomerase family mycothiol-dependent enzyme [Candidatus Dormibacteraeota bacterium]|nr:maleylpyruvate isomerase family mycothiol-dependent enzyme [Candidatus Dormibacteraeota bacterium]